MISGRSLKVIGIYCINEKINILLTLLLVLLNTHHMNEDIEGWKDKRLKLVDL